jgi:hypothetical protein
MLGSVKSMSVQIKEYNSAEAIAENLDKQIEDTKNSLSIYIQKLEEIQSVAEKTKRIREVMLKLAGKKAPAESLGELQIGSINIILEANPVHEMEAIEAVVRSKQARLLTLQKAREDLKWLDQLGETEGITYTVVENQDIPEKILLSGL